MITNEIGSEIQKHVEKMKRKKGHLSKASFCNCHGDVPLLEEFGEVVAALVAGDRLPPIPIYPVMIIGRFGAM